MANNEGIFLPQTPQQPEWQILASNVKFCLYTIVIVFKGDKLQDTVHRPGELVPSNGVYRVVHHQHRLIHEATLTRGMRFPMCRTCEFRVRFTLVRSVKHEVIPFGPGGILTDYAEKKSKAKGV